MLRTRTLFLGGYVVAVACVVWACSGSNTGGFANEDGGASSGSGGGSGGSGSGSGGGEFPDGSLGIGGDGQVVNNGPEGSVTVNTTLYAVTEDTLYSVDPDPTKNYPATSLGTFTGFATLPDGGGTDNTITDIAVNAAGQIYVNTETILYTSTQTGVLTKVATISSSASFYALAFAPAGALGPTAPEYLVGGDGNGNLWSIDPTTGATVELGDFGPDPTTSGNFMALSGDLVFYEVPSDDGGAPTYKGLATIRSCTPPPAKYPNDAPKCDKTNDFLAAVDMGALATAFGGTAVGTLNGGIYGGSTTTLGNGIGHGEMFGLAAVGSNVIGFAKYQSADAGPIAPSLWSIDTTPTGGAGTLIPESFSFTNGWSGAGVTSKVTINVPPPPPPPPAPK